MGTSPKSRGRCAGIGMVSALLALGVLAAGPVLGADRVWDAGPSGTGTYWYDPANWSPDGGPAASDGLTVTFGTPVTGSSVYVDADGAIRLCNAGTAADFGLLYLGNTSTGRLEVTSDASLSVYAARVGATGGASGVAVVDDGTWTVDEYLGVGFQGSAGNVATGDLTVRGGGSVQADRVYVGDWGYTDGNVLVTGAGSSLSMDNWLVVGLEAHSAGVLRVEAGGAVSDSEARIGEKADSTGAVTVSGADSSWDTTGSVYLGGSATAAGGTGTITVQDGAEMSVGDTLKLWAGGALNVDGGGVRIGTPASDPLAGQIKIGPGGVLSLADGATVSAESFAHSCPR